MARSSSGDYDAEVSVGPTAEETVGTVRDEDEEAFAWATASLGWARARGKGRLERLVAALVDDLAFGLGAGTARRVHAASRARASRTRADRRSGRPAAGRTEEPGG